MVKLGLEVFELARASAIDSELCQRFMQLAAARWALRFTMLIMCSPIKKTTIYSGLMVIDKHLPINYQLIKFQQEHREPRQPGGCKLKTAPVRPVVAARPAEYVCSEDLFY